MAIKRRKMGCYEFEKKRKHGPGAEYVSRK
jgi:hypothetical protein